MLGGVRGDLAALSAVLAPGPRKTFLTDAERRQLAEIDLILERAAQHLEHCRAAVEAAAAALRDAEQQADLAIVAGERSPALSEHRARLREAAEDAQRAANGLYAAREGAMARTRPIFEAASERWRLEYLGAALDLDRALDQVLAANGRLRDLHELGAGLCRELGLDEPARLDMAWLPARATTWRTEIAVATAPPEPPKDASLDDHQGRSTPQPVAAPPIFEPSPGPAVVVDRTKHEPIGAAADPHRALWPLIEAASQTHAKTAVLPVPMIWQGWPRLPWRLELLVKALLFLVPHARLVRQIWRRRDHDLILVREFLTALLLVVWPLIWPHRRRVYFLINHNLQEAHRRRLERFVLRLLYRTGGCFACFESTAGWTEIGIVPDAERFLVLPHPLAGAIVTRPSTPPAGELVVGVIGAVRAEKGSEAILEALLQLREHGRLPVRLVLGCPEANVRAVWQCQGFEVIDTSSHAAYLAALDLCDVVVLNYQRERYLYRPSGVVADALSRGAAVVCPDFPLMRLQLSAPAAVGAVFGSLAELAEAIKKALMLRPTLGDALAAHQRARDPAAVARLLDAFVADTLWRRSPLIFTTSVRRRSGPAAPIHGDHIWPDNHPGRGR